MECGQRSLTSCMKFSAALIDSMSIEITRDLWWMKYYNVEEKR